MRIEVGYVTFKRTWRLAVLAAYRQARLRPCLADGLVIRAANTDTAAVTGSWLVERFQGGSVTDLAQITITFDRENHAFGSSGCNRFRGPFKRDGETIGIGPLAATKKMCAPVLMAREKNSSPRSMMCASFSSLATP